jgi:hypothetical protein
VKHLCRLVAAGCAGFVSLACFGQNAPTFTSETSPTGPTPSLIHAVDVNNDGIADILQDTAQPGSTGSYFAVSINNGNGTFKPPVTYKINANTWTALTWGDFNHDGKLDIAVAVPPNQIQMFLGNGDGTFKTPVITTLDLPSGSTLGEYPESTIAAADFDHDGNTDLVVSAHQNDPYSGPWQVYVLHGDGTGSFNNPTSIYQPTSGWLVDTILTGDFDSDDNADVAILEHLPCAGGATFCVGNGSASNVLALFGDGTGSFTPVDVTTINGASMTLGAADLNNDAATDLYGIENFAQNGQIQLAVFLGHYGRKFGYRFTPMPSNFGNIGSSIVAADFNGTGNWALAALNNASDSGGAQMVYFLNAGTSSPSIVTGPSPAGVSGWQFGPVVGNFNGDTRPDIAVVSSPSLQSPTSIIAAGINANTQGFYGGCNYPSTGQGIHLCSPPGPSAAGPLTFAASANSFGQLRKMELWVDGAKLGEQRWVWGQNAYFNLSNPNVSPGTHDGTIFAADVDNTLQRYDFTFTVNP